MSALHATKKSTGNEEAEEALAHTCAGSPNRVTFAGRHVTSHTLLLLLYVEMSADILHLRLVASWLNCKHSWESNSFMTMSLKSDGRPGETESNEEANKWRKLNH